MTFKDLTNNDKIYMFSDKIKFNTYFVNKIFPGESIVNITLTPVDDSQDAYNKILTVPGDVSFYTITDNKETVIVTCDKRVCELISNVARLTKNAIGVSFNELFGNVFKTNL